MSEERKDLVSELGKVLEAIHTASVPRNSEEAIDKAMRHLPAGERLFVIVRDPEDGFDDYGSLGRSYGPHSTLLWDLLSQPPTVAEHATVCIVHLYFPEGETDYQSLYLYEWDGKEWAPIDGGDREIEGMRFYYEVKDFRSPGWPNPYR